MMPVPGKKTPQQQRRFQRVKPLGLMGRTGKLIVGSRFPVLNCSIVDYSAGGACLGIDLNAVDSLPQRFELEYSGVRKKCRLVWKRGRHFGVCF
jgi:hypothetical protein